MLATYNRRNVSRVLATVMVIGGVLIPVNRYRCVIRMTRLCGLLVRLKILLNRLRLVNCRAIVNSGTVRLLKVLVMRPLLLIVNLCLTMLVCWRMWRLATMSIGPLRMVGN